MLDESYHGQNHASSVFPYYFYTVTLWPFAMIVISEELMQDFFFLALSYTVMMIVMKCFPTRNQNTLFCQLYSARYI